MNTDNYIILKSDSEEVFYVVDTSGDEIVSGPHSTEMEATRQRSSIIQEKYEEHLSSAWEHQHEFVERCTYLIDMLDIISKEGDHAPAKEIVKTLYKDCERPVSWYEDAVEYIASNGEHPDNPSGVAQKEGKQE